MSFKQADIDAVLSLDIGHHSLKVLAFTRDEAQLVCHHAATIPFFDNGKARGQTECIGQLKDELATWKFRSHGVKVALSGDMSTVRFIEVPHITKAQLLTNIGFDAGKYIPFPLKDTYFDCDVFSSAAGEKESKITAVVAAVKREAVGNVMKLLHGLEVSADLLDVSPLAIFNAFEAFGDPASEPLRCYAILDLGYQKSHVGIVQDKMPAFTRDLEVGGVRLDQADHDSACQILADQIANSFDFFEAARGLSPQGMFVTGGGSLREGLTPFLSGALEIPVTVWNPMESPKVRVEENAVACKDKGMLFGVCLGLATRGGGA